MFGGDGHLVSKDHWAKGVLHGEQERYFESGKIKSTMTWAAGQQTGPATIYREIPDSKAKAQPGEKVPMIRSLFEQGAHENGRRTGVWSEFYPNGKVKTKGPYVNGKREGLWNFYLADGGDEASGRYLADEQSGHWVGYHPGGGKKFEGEFLVGVAQGAWTRWWPSGQKKAQGSILDGKWHGEWKAWDKDGRVDAKLTGTYSQGTKQK